MGRRKTSSTRGGIKQEGFKELSWNKVDLDLYLANKQ